MFQKKNSCLTFFEQNKKLASHVCRSIANRDARLKLFLKAVTGYTYKTSPASAFWFAFLERVLGGVGGGDSRISFLQGGLVGSEVAQDRFSSGEVGGSEIAGLSPVFYYVAIF
jgi:hypothetical protein